MTERVYTVLFPFCGVGGGALGFQQAGADFRRLGVAARFQVLGGIEMEPSTARDFTRLTGAPCLTADVSKLTQEELRAAFGDEAPDVIFFSPPCKQASGLLAKDLACSPKYAAMGALAGVWCDLMFAAWPRGPKLLLMENVPRIRTRAPEVMAKVRKTLRAHGYLIHEESHDLGVVGGLAQHRDRLLLVGRRRDVPTLLYQPTPRRVRSVGEVLGALPMPGDPAAGPLHRLPAISALTALRLALIPAGGDWSDLPSQVYLPRELAAAVARSRGPSTRTPFNDVYRVIRWDDPSPCVTAGAAPSAGGLSIADPRPATQSHPHTYGVLPWNGAAHTITGNTVPGGGPFSVADPRENSGIYGVIPWTEPSGTIVGHACHDNGRFSVADPRQPASVPFPVILSEDGTWHRPLTTLECAVLQSFPATLAGEPFALEGGTDRARVKIGDAVPVAAAKRVAEQMLYTLVDATLGSFSLSSGGAVWVERGDPPGRRAGEGGHRPARLPGHAGGLICTAGTGPHIPPGPTG